MIAVVGRWGRRWLAGAAWAGVALVVAIGPLLVRVAWEGRAELIAADEAAAAGRVDLEIVHLGRAARWRAPFAASDDAAIGRLLALGAAHEGDEATLTTALAAYRELRGALWATRVRAPEGEALALTNGRIAALMAAQERAFATDLSRRGAQEAYHLALLAAGPEDR